MNKQTQDSVREARQTFDLLGAMPLASPDPAKPMRAKVFKSGNSLALRLPKALGMEAGMELELVPDGLGSHTLRRANAPKRKFNIDKVWGCAIGSGLQVIKDEDRLFEERSLLWDDPEWRAKHLPDT